MSRVILFSLALFAARGLAAPMPAAARYDATITRTQYGIPHVVAKDWRGIGYGVGYAYAEDNLCLLAEEFMTIAGERSLHFGPKAKAVLAFGEVENLTSDLFFRAAVDVSALRRSAKAQGREALLLIDGYVAGYNRRLRDIGPAGIPAACRGKSWVRAISTDDMLRLGEKQVLLASSLALAAGIANAAPPAAKPIANILPSAAKAALPTMHETGFGSKRASPNRRRNSSSITL